MTAIPEALVATVVREVSQKMKSPEYAQTAVGAFVQRHPDVGRWVAAQAADVGGAAGVATVIFHAELLNECYRRHAGKNPSTVRFTTLDVAAKGDPLKSLGTKQPALHDYLAANVEGAKPTKVLATIALALHALAAPAAPKKPPA
jgi:hypothetical protein